MKTVFDKVGYPQVGRGSLDAVALGLLQAVERIRDEEGGEEREEQDQQDRHQLDQGRVSVGLKTTEEEEDIVKPKISAL